MMKKVISLLLCLSIMFSLSIPVSAENLTRSVAKTAITRWIQYAKTYAGKDIFESYVSLFDENMAIDEDEYEFFKNYVYTEKYKCTYNIVSITDNNVIADVFFYRNIKNNTAYTALHETYTYSFEIRNTKAIRIPYKPDTKSNTYDSDIYWVKYSKSLLYGVNAGVKKAEINKNELTVTLTIANGTENAVSKIILLNSLGPSYIMFDEKKRVNINIPNRTIDEIFDTTLDKNAVADFTFTIPVPVENMDISYCDWQFHLSYS